MALTYGWSLLLCIATAGSLLSEESTVTSQYPQCHHHIQGHILCSLLLLLPPPSSQLPATLSTALRTAAIIVLILHPSSFLPPQGLLHSLTAHSVLTESLKFHERDSLFLLRSDCINQKSRAFYTDVVNLPQMVSQTA